MNFTEETEIGREFPAYGFDYTKNDLLLNLFRANYLAMNTFPQICPFHVLQ